MCCKNIIGFVQFGPNHSSLNGSGTNLDRKFLGGGGLGHCSETA